MYNEARMFGVATGVAVGLVLALVIVRTVNRDRKLRTEYDEMQKLARGQAYKYAFYAVMIYEALVCWLSMGIELPAEQSVIHFFGIFVGITVQACYCIWKDAYIGHEPEKVHHPGDDRVRSQPARGVHGLESRRAVCRWQIPAADDQPSLRTDVCGDRRSRPCQKTGRQGGGRMKNLKLKAARAGMDMSQADLAEAVGVSRQTISAIEKGDYNPTINLCIKICKVLGKTLDELFWTEE